MNLAIVVICTFLGSILALFEQLLRCAQLVTLRSGYLYVSSLSRFLAPESRDPSELVMMELVRAQS